MRFLSVLMVLTVMVAAVYGGYRGNRFIGGHSGNGAGFNPGFIGGSGHGFNGGFNREFTGGFNRGFSQGIGVRAYGQPYGYRG
ncbi:armadillidin-like [Homarus americanus]|uniref:armadillidin-like n=1 Tax=Homarus americanus TaxID=6706 RepID=UPI001C493A42|nr:armadillidin-like [Homarus americanus]